MRNKIFTVLIFVLFILGLSIFVLPQSDTTMLERRKLSTNTDVVLDNLAETLNNVLNDQSPFRDISIKSINVIKQSSNKVFNNTLLKIKDNVIMLDGEYIINDFITIKDEDRNTALNKAYNIQQISEKYSNVKVYVYFPTRIEETTLLDSEKIKSVYTNLKEDFLNQLGRLVKTDCLDLDSVDKFKECFYKTDHHWNGNGVYEGYKDIIDLMQKDFEIEDYKDASIVTYPYDFYGSYAQKIAFMCTPDKLIDINVEVSDYKYFVNGKLTDDEAALKNYRENGNIQPQYSDYEYVYGGNDFERIYDFNQQEKPNVLIFADSFINPLKRALASHFNKTIIIDMRANEGNFSLDEYINKYNIDAILFLQYYEDLYFNGYLFVPLN